MPKLLNFENSSSSASVVLRGSGEEVSVFPLSLAQERLWFLDQLDPGNPVYNVSKAWRLKGSVDLMVLQQSLNEIVRRHEALRTTFALQDGQPVQVIASSLRLPLQVVDLRVFRETERESEALRLAAEEAQGPFDLTRGPLLRATLLRIHDQEHFFLLTMHHIVSDGSSERIFVRELETLYEAFSAGQPSPLPELAMQYADFALWQSQWLQSDALEADFSYWNRQLADLPVLEVPADHPRPPVQTFRAARLSRTLSRHVFEGLEALSRRECVTMFMTLLATFKVLLHRYTGQEDLVVGTPTAGRRQEETEGLIGLFANNLVLRTDCSGNPTFRDLLHRVRDVTLETYAHQDLPFEKLVEELPPVRDLSRLQLFQVYFNMPNPAELEMRLPGISAEILPSLEVGSKADLTLSVEEKESGIQLTFIYNTDLFEHNTIVRLVGHLQNLLEGIAANPDRRLSALPILTEAERRQILLDWNGTRADYPQDKCLHQLFEAQTERTPNSVAAVFENKRITYRELNSIANETALSLASKGIRKGSYVPVLMDRSLELIISLLSVMKAGAAFVPLDIGWPTKTIKLILDQLKSDVILVNKTTRKKDLGSTFLLVDGKTNGDSIPNGSSTIDSSDPVCVMYASGSTGKPRGVVIPHRAITNRFSWMNECFGRDAAAAALQTTREGYDSAIWQLFWPLINGGKTIVPSPDAEQSLDYLTSLIEKHQVTIADFVPSFFDAIVPEIVASNKSGRRLSSLRCVVVGGEEITPAVAYSFLDHFPNVRLINLYGPAEASLGCIYHDVSRTRRSKIPIGKPVSNAHALILDRYGNLVPVGVPGEIHVSGVCLGTGYLNDEPGTRAAFVPNSFAEIGYDKLYKTGDLARYLPDGNIESLGPIDRQVMVRGHRIELREIEAVLREHPAVQDTVVLACEYAPADNRLVAYVTGRQLTPTSNDLRSFLKERLPDYMLPSAFIPMEKLSLAPNRKLDRRRLPPSGQDRSLLEEAFVSPRDTLELQLAAIWENALGVRPIGVRDNFFDLGGHSMPAVSLVVQIEKAFGKKLPLATLFRSPTIEQLACTLREGGRSPSESSLVAIQTGTSRPPIFCVDPFGGDVLTYRSLAHHLGPDQPFFGLKAQGLDRKQLRIQDMAAHYIKEIRKLQGEGPYSLCGLSLGGVIAFEMAQQLHVHGQKVALLALFDTVAPQPPNLLPNRASSLPEVDCLAGRIYGHPANLVVWGDKNKVRRITERARIIEITPARQRLTKERIWKIAYSFCRMINRPLPPFLRDVKQIQRQALKEYVPHVYPGRLTLFRATGEYNPGICTDPTYGWNLLAAEGLEIHEVPGDRESIFREPCVRVLAQKLGACLKAAYAAESDFRELMARKALVLA